MATYVWRDGKFVDKKTGEPLLTEEQRASTELCCPHIRSDLSGYRSPVTGKWIEGRAARRDDLARSGCREVDPSEGKDLVYRNYEFCQKHRKPYLGGDVPPAMTRDEKQALRERKAKDKAAEKAAEATRAQKAAESTDPELAKFTRGNPYTETLSGKLQETKRASA